MNAGAPSPSHAFPGDSPIARLVAAKVGFASGMNGFAPVVRSPLHRVESDTHAHAVTRAVTTLRLVQDPHEAVISENRRAAELSETDVRWALAIKVADTLEGGTLAMLRPERRRQLMTHARRIGLRDFDTSLVIAVVQDAARRAEPIAGEGDVAARLGMIGVGALPTNHARSMTSASRVAASRRWLQAVLIAFLASTALWAMIRWITRS